MCFILDWTRVEFKLSSEKLFFSRWMWTQFSRTNFIVHCDSQTSKWSNSKGNIFFSGRDKACHFTTVTVYWIVSNMGMVFDSNLSKINPVPIPLIDFTTYFVTALWPHSTLSSLIVLLLQQKMTIPLHQGSCAASVESGVKTTVKTLVLFSMESISTK